MSSFVINKCSYIKCAAVFAALADCRDYYRDPVFREWNKRERRNYIDDDFKKDFTRLYEINAAAVRDQYNDATAASDAENYNADFERIRQNIVELWRVKSNNFEKRAILQRTLYGVIRFFRSVQYQIEGDEYTRRALMIMNKYYRGLYKALRIVDNVADEDLSGYWGDFDIAE